MALRKARILKPPPAVRWRWHNPFWRAVGVFAVTAAALAQQTIDPSEMHVSGGRYTPPPAAIIRTQVNLVEVPVVVRDSANRAVAGLQRNDFQVYDSGKPRPIASFAVETAKGGGVPPASTPAGPAPPPPPTATAGDRPQRFVALLFDDLNTGVADLHYAKTAAERFVKQWLSPGDRLAVATTAWQRPLVFSADGAELIKQIEAVTPHSRFSDALLAALACPTLNAYEAYLISNYLDPQLLAAKVAEYRACSGDPRASADRVVNLARNLWEEARGNSDFSLRAIRAVVDAMAKLPGRRMILLTSSGFLSGELENDLSELEHRALYAGVVIDTLESRGLYAYAPGGDLSQTPPARQSGRAAIQAKTVELRLEAARNDAPDDALASLALGTGGTFFHNSNDLAAGYRDLGAVPDVVYVLGISVGDVVRDGKYHPLKVRLAAGRRGSVQARPGYLAPLPNPPVAPAPAPERAIDREFLAGDTLDDVPATLTAIPREDSTSAPALTVRAQVDVGKLNLDLRDGRRRQSLILVAGLLDTNGTFVTGKQGQLDLALKEATYGDLGSLGLKGLSMSLTLDAPPGKYILRGVVQEGLTGKMTSVNQALEIH